MFDFSHIIPVTVFIPDLSTVGFMLLVLTWHVVLLCVCTGGGAGGLKKKVPELSHIFENMPSPPFFLFISPQPFSVEFMTTFKRIVEIKNQNAKHLYMQVIISTCFKELIHDDVSKDMGFHIWKVHTFSQWPHSPPTF